MHNVAVGAVCVFAAGHDDKVTVARINDFNVVYGERIVEGDGYDGLHGTLVKKLSDLDICDLHFRSP
jgi:hypothetical protein